MPLRLTPLCEAFHEDVELRLDELADLIRLTDTALLSRVRDLERLGERMHLHPEEAGAWEALHGELRFRLVDAFPRTLWGSLLVMNYALIEDEMNALSRLLARLRGYPLTLEDLSGTGIFRARNYLSKVAGVRQPFRSRAWEEVLAVNRIRNQIVHDAGRLGRDRRADAIRRHAAVTPGLFVDRERGITLTRGYLLDVVDASRAFFFDLAVSARQCR